MNDEGLICKAPRECLAADEPMERAVCTHSARNNRRIGKRRPFFGARRAKAEALA